MKRGGEGGWFNEERAKKYQKMISNYEEELQEEEELEEELENAEREIERLESEVIEKKDALYDVEREISKKIQECQGIRNTIEDLDSDEEEDDEDDDDDDDAGGDDSKITKTQCKNDMWDIETEIEDLQIEKSRLREEIVDLEDEISFEKPSKNELERRLVNIKDRRGCLDDIKEELECLEIAKRIDAVCEEDGNILVSGSFKDSKMYHYIFHHEYIYTGIEARDLIGCEWKTAIAGRMRIFPVPAEDVEQFPDGSIRCAPYVFEKENIFGDFDGSEKGFILSFQNPE